MGNVKALLDAAKAATGAESDYRLAQTLELPKQRISEYYNGKASPDEFACLKIAEAVGMPLDAVIATVKAEAEKDEKRREEWRGYLKKVGGMAASVAMPVIAAVILQMTPTPANAHGSVVSDSGLFVLCKVVRRIRTATEAVQRALNMIFRRVYSPGLLSGGIVA